MHGLAAVDAIGGSGVDELGKQETIRTPANYSAWCGDPRAQKATTHMQLTDGGVETIFMSEIDHILSGLTAMQPTISHVYLYDDRGTHLYEQITQTEEYYPTRTELALIAAQATEIATFPPGVPMLDSQVICELGAGDGHKTMVLLMAAAKRAHQTVYLPIDVSQAALNANVAAFERERLGGDGSAVRVDPLCGRYETCLPLVRSLPGTKTFLFLGSSIGNYDQAGSIALLQLVQAQMGRGDRLLLGVDTPHGTQKPVEVIIAAYNDAAGLTAAFTLNALRHLNATAGFNFDWENGWRHVAVYDEAAEAIVTHAEAVGPQVVSRGEGVGSQHPVRSFAAGERIFVEQSRKFSMLTIRQMAAAAGLTVRRHWCATKDWHMIVEMVRGEPE